MGVNLYAMVFNLKFNMRGLRMVDRSWTGLRVARRSFASSARIKCGSPKTNILHYFKAQALVKSSPLKGGYLL